MGARNLFLVALGVAALAALTYGSIVENVWALMAATYAAAVILIVWLGGRRRGRR